MKKKVVIVLVILIIIVGGYLGYKVYYLNKYNVDDMEEYYQKFINLVGEKDTYTVHASKLDDSEYYIFDELCIKNFFSGFQEDKISSHVKTFTTLTGESTNVSLFHHELPLYLAYPPLTKKDAIYMNKFMNKNHLNTILDLFDYLYQNQDRKVGIFDSLSTIRENYVVMFNVGSFALSDSYSDEKLTYLTGDYLGYLHEAKFNLDSGEILNCYIVHFIVDEEEYGFTILTSDEKIDKQYVLDLINTIEFV